ncbi:MAG: hypothetical protein ACYTHJ_06220 [Planctomycetota bacterium]|jgi:LPS sulfotransferase NodH
MPLSSLSNFLGIGSRPAVRFALLFQGRTGSSYLISCLNSHPAIVAEGEKLVRQSHDWQRRWLTQLYAGKHKRGTLACGFKTKLKDVWDLREFAEMLQRLDIRIISMMRKNKVKMAVSAINARRLYDATGHWNLRPGMDPLPPFELSADDLRAQVQHAIQSDEALQQFVSGLNLPTLAIAYEDLLDDRHLQLARVLQFLGVEQLPLHGDVIKNTSDNLAEVLVNHGELKKAFANDPIGEML